MEKLRVESEELRVGKKVEREIGDSCASGESVASHGGDAVRTEKAVAMTAETDRMEAEARQMLKEVSRRRSVVAKLRKVVRNGELIKNQEHKARLMFEEKVKRLATMPVE